MAICPQRVRQTSILTTAFRQLEMTRHFILKSRSNRDHFASAHQNKIREYLIVVSLTVPRR